MDMMLCQVTLILLVIYGTINSLITLKIHKRTKKIEQKGN